MRNLHNRNSTLALAADLILSALTRKELVGDRHAQDRALQQFYSTPGSGPLLGLLWATIVGSLSEWISELAVCGLAQVARRRSARRPGVRKTYICQNSGLCRVDRVGVIDWLWRRRTQADQGNRNTEL